MHVLITTDTVGGVWTYTEELVTGLISRGVRITLVSLGALPRPAQISWMSKLPGLDYRPTDYRLEWMEVAQRDIEESRAYLEMVVREVQPDLLHLNQYCYGDLAPGVPRVVVAHSDVVSWWVGVHGREPEDSPWMRWYRDTVTRGLSRADVVVSPSHWMQEQLRTYYRHPGCGRVIYNGRDPRLFEGSVVKESCVLSVGRMWDEGKQMSLLLAAEQAVPVYLAGSLDHPGRATATLERPAPKQVHVLGEQTHQQLQQLLARAAIYAATSCYEPFGLAPVEAALSRCALIANDTPTFHELWGDSAWYFRRNDAHDLAASISRLAGDSALREQYGERAYQTACAKFATEKMIDLYELVYETLQPAGRLA
jgi:glycosyltransferase involved in cell wall biosynthesis